MINPRLLEAAERWKNPVPPEDKPSQKTTTQNREQITKKYSFLEGELAREVHDWIQKTYPDFPNITKINYDSNDKIIKGSNPFYVTAVNDYFRKNNLEIRTASQAELEQILKSNSLELEKHYEDTSLVLRTEDEPNKYLAKNLAGQIKKRQKIKLPLMIPLRGLTLKQDSNSPHKYSFQLTNEVEIIYSDKLAHENNGKKFDEADEYGLPVFNENGKRTFYTRNDGLSGLCLGGDLGLGAHYDLLAYSAALGRVVLVSPEGAQNFEGYVSRLKQEKEKQISEFDSRFNEAVKYLKTGKL